MLRVEDHIAVQAESESGAHESDQLVSISGISWSSANVFLVSVPSLMKTLSCELSAVDVPRITRHSFTKRMEAIIADVNDSLRAYLRMDDYQNFPYSGYGDIIYAKETLSGTMGNVQYASTLTSLTWLSLQESLLQAGLACVTRMLPLRSKELLEAERVGSLARGTWLKFFTNFETSSVFRLRATCQVDGVLRGDVYQVTWLSWNKEQHESKDDASTQAAFNALPGLLLLDSTACFSVATERGFRALRWAQRNLLHKKLDVTVNSVYPADRDVSNNVLREEYEQLQHARGSVCASLAVPVQDRFLSSSSSLSLASSSSSVPPEGCALELKEVELDVGIHMIEIGHGLARHPEEATVPRACNFAAMFRVISRLVERDVRTQLAEELNVSNSGQVAFASLESFALRHAVSWHLPRSCAISLTEFCGPLWSTCAAHHHNVVVPVSSYGSANAGNASAGATVDALASSVGGPLTGATRYCWNTYVWGGTQDSDPRTEPHMLRSSPLRCVLPMQVFPEHAIQIYGVIQSISVIQIDENGHRCPLACSSSSSGSNAANKPQCSFLQIEVLALMRADWCTCVRASLDLTIAGTLDFLPAPYRMFFDSVDVNITWTPQRAYTTTSSSDNAAVEYADTMHISVTPYAASKYNPAAHVFGAHGVYAHTSTSATRRLTAPLDMPSVVFVVDVVVHSQNGMTGVREEVTRGQEVYLVCSSTATDTTTTTTITAAPGRDQLKHVAIELGDEAVEVINEMDGCLSRETAAAAGGDDDSGDGEVAPAAAATVAMVEEDGLVNGGSAAISQDYIPTTVRATATKTRALEIYHRSSILFFFELDSGLFAAAQGSTSSLSSSFSSSSSSSSLSDKLTRLRNQCDKLIYKDVMCIPAGIAEVAAVRGFVGDLLLLNNKGEVAAATAAGTDAMGSGPRTTSKLEPLGLPLGPESYFTRSLLHEFRPFLRSIASPQWPSCDDLYVVAWRQRERQLVLDVLSERHELQTQLLRRHTEMLGAVCKSAVHYLGAMSLPPQVSPDRESEEMCLLGCAEAALSPCEGVTKFLHLSAGSSLLLWSDATRSELFPTLPHSVLPSSLPLAMFSFASRQLFGSNPDKEVTLCRKDKTPMCGARMQHKDWTLNRLAMPPLPNLFRCDFERLPLLTHSCASALCAHLIDMARSHGDNDGNIAAPTTASGGGGTAKCEDDGIAASPHDVPLYGEDNVLSSIMSMLFFLQSAMLTSSCPPSFSSTSPNGDGDAELAAAAAAASALQPAFCDPDENRRVLRQMVVEQVAPMISLPEGDMGYNATLYLLPQESPNERVTVATGDAGSAEQCSSNYVRTNFCFPLMFLGNRESTDSISIQSHHSQSEQSSMMDSILPRAMARGFLQKCICSLAVEQLTRDNNDVAAAATAATTTTTEGGSVTQELIATATEGLATLNAMHGIGPFAARGHRKFMYRPLPWLFVLGNPLVVREEDAAPTIHLNGAAATTPPPGQNGEGSTVKRVFDLRYRVILPHHSRHLYKQSTVSRFGSRFVYDTELRAQKRGSLVSAYFSLMLRRFGTSFSSPPLSAHGAISGGSNRDDIGNGHLPDGVLTVYGVPSQPLVMAYRSRKDMRLSMGMVSPVVQSFGIDRPTDPVLCNDASSSSSSGKNMKGNGAPFYSFSSEAIEDKIETDEVKYLGGLASTISHILQLIYERLSARMKRCGSCVPSRVFLRFYLYNMPGIIDSYMVVRVFPVDESATIQPSLSQMLSGAAAAQPSSNPYRPYNLLEVMLQRPMMELRVTYAIEAEKFVFSWNESAEMSASGM